MTTVAIIGAGFSGTMTAAQLLRQAGAAGRALQVVLFDRAHAFAAGVAYRTSDERHLLNVPAAKMTAWPERPDSFLDWARARDAAVRAGDFLPRMQYGAYLRAQLDAARDAAAPHATLELCAADVLGLAPSPRGFTVSLAGRSSDGTSNDDTSSTGTSLAVDAAVLAIGHRQPSDPLAQLWHGPRDRFLADPWPSLDPSAIGPDEPVTILGSGLSAIDAWLTLTRAPRTAPITFVSRRGLLPRVHARQPIAPIDLGAQLSPSLRSLVAVIRRALSAAADWRAVVDGLRPHSAALWSALSPAEQAGFLRHIRPLWEVHRHRMAPQIADLVDTHLRTGQLRTLAGRVRAVDARPDRARLTVDLRDGSSTTLDAGWVINCTGPGHHKTSLPAPLPSLIAAGLIEPDPLGLGVATGPHHEAVVAGAPIPRLFVLGTLCKPRLWESTAVPELRVQAQTVARQLLTALA